MASLERVLAIFDQQLVQMMVRADDRNIARALNERDLVNRRSEFNAAAEKIDQFPINPVPTMGKLDPSRDQPGGCELSAKPEQDRGEKLDLMFFEMSADAAIRERDRRVPAGEVFQQNAFVGDGRISHQPLESIAQRLRRR